MRDLFMHIARTERRVSRRYDLHFPVRYRVSQKGAAAHASSRTSAYIIINMPETTYRGRRAFTVENERLRVTVLRENPESQPLLPSNPK